MTKVEHVAAAEEWLAEAEAQHAAYLEDQEGANVRAGNSRPRYFLDRRDGALRLAEVHAQLAKVVTTA